MEFDDFIDAIVAEPDVDEHRLIFADYLEEHSDPRAELIRLQFAMREMSKSDSKWAGLRKRELRLLSEHGGFGKRPKFGKILRWHGGFVDEIETTLAQLASNNAELLSGTTVRGIQLRSSSKRFKKLFDSPYLGRLKKLTFKSNHIPTNELCEFLSLDGLANLKELSITDEFGVEIAETIGQMRHFSSLESLKLRGGFVEGNSAIAIVESPYINGLTSLALGGSISEEATERIANADKFKNLTSLWLSGEITNRNVAALHDSVFRETLSELVLFSGHLRGSPSGFANVLPNLKYLELGWSVDNDTLISIAENYRNLEILELGGNQIGDPGAEALAQSELLANLKRLVFTGNQITIRGAQAMRESEYWTGKTKLFLRSNNINNEQRTALKEKYGKTFGNLGSDWIRPF